MEFLPVFCSGEKPKGAGIESDEEMSVYGFISSMTISLQTVLLVTTAEVERELRIRVLKRAMKLVFLPVQEVS